MAVASAASSVLGEYLGTLLWPCPGPVITGGLRTGDRVGEMGRPEAFLLNVLTLPFGGQS